MIHIAPEVDLDCSGPKLDWDSTQAQAENINQLALAVADVIVGP